MIIDKPHILFDNRLDDGTPTATTTDPDTQYNVLNLSDWRTYTFWKGTSTLDQFITIDAGVAKSADSVAIIAHDLFTRGATISVEYSDNGTAWPIALFPVALTDNKAFFRKFTSSSHRFWRLRISGMSAPAFIGILVIGQRLTMEQYLENQYNPDEEKLQMEDNVGDTGQLLGVVRSHTSKSYSVNFMGLSTNWIDNTFKPAWDLHLSKGKPFFWIWNFTNYPNDIQLVRIKSDYTLQMPFETIERNLFLEFIGVKE